MFLKRFKLRSNHKYINNLLEESSRSVPSGKIDSVGVIFDFNEFNNYDAMRAVLKRIGFMDNKVRFIALIDDEKSRPNTWDNFFSPDDFGWSGKLKGIELTDFVNTDFDALICYSKTESLDIDLAVAISRAKLKIGISTHDERLYDLIIDIDPKYTDVFEQELFKYLKVLNKI